MNRHMERYLLVRMYERHPGRFVCRADMAEGRALRALVASGKATADVLGTDARWTLAQNYLHAELTEEGLTEAACAYAEEALGA